MFVYADEIRVISLCNIFPFPNYDAPGNIKGNEGRGKVFTLFKYLIAFTTEFEVFFYVLRPPEMFWIIDKRVN